MDFKTLWPQIKDVLQTLSLFLAITCAAYLLFVPDALVSFRQRAVCAANEPTIEGIQNGSICATFISCKQAGNVSALQPDYDFNYLTGNKTKK